MSGPTKAMLQEIITRLRAEKAQAQVDRQEAEREVKRLSGSLEGVRARNFERKIEELECEVSGLRECIKARTAMYDSLMRQCDYLEGLVRKSKKRAKRYKAALQAVCAVVAGAD